MNEAQYVVGMMGCSDGGCMFNYKKPGTMVTNGGCTCQRELMRTEQGMKAVMLIQYLRANWPSMPFAGYPSVPEDRQMPQLSHKESLTRTMTHKVHMIKEIREKTGAGLKESKEAMDAVYGECVTYDEVIRKGIAHIENKNGYCRMGDNCVCGGDTPRVRAGCFDWKALPKPVKEIICCMPQGHPSHCGCEWQ